jgi:plasmid stability protein
MVFHMKTTLNIDDNVMRRLREEAARRGRTMSELVEAGLRRVLDEPEQVSDQLQEPLPRWRSGGAFVDLADRDALYERMDRD